MPRMIIRILRWLSIFHRYYLDSQYQEDFTQRKYTARGLIRKVLRGCQSLHTLSRTRYRREIQSKHRVRVMKKKTRLFLKRRTVNTHHRQYQNNGMIVYSHLRVSIIYALGKFNENISKIKQRKYIVNSIYIYICWY